MPGFDHFSILAPLYEKFIPPVMPARLMDLLKLPVEGAVLDAGGGTGRLAQFLRGRACQVVLADETLQMTLEARGKVGIDPLCAHTEWLPFADGLFARILMVDALHHVSDQPQTLREMWRVLAPGGRLVIEEPDIRHFSVKLIAVAEKLLLMRSHFLSPDAMSALFPFADAVVRWEAEGGAAWVIAEKSRKLVDVLPAA